MKKASTTPHFEVDFKDRQAQSREAKQLSAYRATGRKKYYVTKTPEKTKLNQLYGTGPVKASLGPYSKYLMADAALAYFLDELYAVKETRWLKPKQATVLRLQGYVVEEVV